VVIPKWLAVLRSENKSSGSKILVLVSGSGLPRNPELSRDSNSTEMLAHLIQVFVKIAYPDIHFYQCPSDDNIYRCEGDPASFVVVVVLFWSGAMLLPCCPGHPVLEPAHMLVHEPLCVRVCVCSWAFAMVARFDDNIKFVSQVLRPRIDDERRKLVGIWQDQWRDHLSVTISLAGGPPAR
jgi:hypothetical protein